MAELLADDSLDAVVELTGGIEEPLDWSRATLRAGRAYVTGNKALLATHGGELAELARQNRAALLGSASVGGGTPMIETVQHLATAGGIGRIRGLLNATTTFILAAMGEGRSYDAALARRRTRATPSRIPPSTSPGATPPRRSPSWPRSPGAAGCRSRQSPRAVSSASASSPARPSASWPRRMSRGARVGPMALGADDPLAGVSGIECLLEVQLREGAVFRLAGPGAGGPVSVRATYADLGRLLAGERPILFAPQVAS